MGGSSFSYDAFGRRTVKTEPLVQGGTQTKNYGWTGWSQTSGNQAPVVGSGLDSPIRLERGTDGTVRVPVQDAHGNVTKVINGGSGGQLFGASYSPFGERVITLNNGMGGADGMGQPVGFTGAEHDSVSQLVYLRNRYYAPGLGRFISEDPIGFAGGSNFYAYCHNDPINFSDPLGLFSTACPGTLTVGINPDRPWLVFTGQGLSDGLATGWAGFSSAVWSMPGLRHINVGGCIYNGSAYRCQPGYTFSYWSGKVGIYALILAAKWWVRGAEGVGEIEGLSADKPLVTNFGLAGHYDETKEWAGGGFDYYDVDPNVNTNDPHNFMHNIATMMENSDSINFNITGMHYMRTFIEMDDTDLAPGKTNWELNRIFNNPDLLNKTRFWLDGKIISSHEVYQMDN